MLSLMKNYYKNRIWIKEIEAKDKYKIVIFKRSG